jgi:hypothetical protein
VPGADRKEKKTIIAIPAPPSPPWKKCGQYYNIFEDVIYRVYQKDKYTDIPVYIYVFCCETGTKQIKL